MFDRNHVEPPNHNTIIGGSFSTVVGNIIRDRQISKQASSCKSGRLKSTTIQTVDVTGSRSTRRVVSVFFLFFLFIYPLASHGEFDPTAVCRTDVLKLLFTDFSKRA